MTNKQLAAARHRVRLQAICAKAITTVTVRHVDRATIFIGGEGDEKSLEKKVMKEMVAGGTAKYSDGRSEWIHDNEIRVPGEHARPQDAYIWAKDCNRIAHNRVLVTKYADGTMTEVFLRRVYKSF